MNNFIRLVFLLAFSLSTSRFFSLVYFNLHEAKHIHLAKLFNFFPEPNILLLFILVIYILTALCSMVTLNFFSRILFVLLFFLLDDVCNSFGKSNYVLTSWKFILGASFFLKRNDELFSSRNEKVFDIIQVYLLAAYVAAGLWKIKYFFIQGADFSYFKNIMNIIAYSIAEGGGPIPIIRERIAELSDLMILGFLFFFLFQVSSLVPIFIKNLRIIWGILAVSFHFSVGLIMGIWINPLIISATLFLIILPYLQKAKQN